MVEGHFDEALMTDEIIFRYFQILIMSTFIYGDNTETFDWSVGENICPYGKDYAPELNT